MTKFFGTTTQLSEGTVVPVVIEYSFALNITSIAGCYGLMRFLR